MRACPNHVEVLVKCDDSDLLPYAITGADLTGLKRFDCYYARYRDGDHQFATEDDEPSRSQDFLREVVRNSPNLQYLSFVKRFRGLPVEVFLHNLSYYHLLSLFASNQFRSMFGWRERCGFSPIEASAR
jgi:hypothetical protein